MFLTKIVLATLAVAAVPLTTDAQNRRRRRVPARPPAKAEAGRRPAVNGSQGASATVISLSANDMTLVVEGFDLPAAGRAQFASSADERKSLAKDIRQLLSVAEDAKAAGYLARSELKLQIELARAFVIAQRYLKYTGAAAPEQIVSAVEIDAFFNEPATPAQFEAFVKDIAKNEGGGGKPVSDEQRNQMRGQYGRLMVAMRKGVAAGLDRERKTQLAIMLYQARMLATAYMKELEPRFKATEAEVDAYIAAHPEFDPKPARAKIEKLLARARAGEDFARLADEFTEDPSGKGTGGDLGWFGRGVMVKPFEDAAFALKQGEISGIVESPFGYHIIKFEERRQIGGVAGEQVRARHILIRYFNAKLNSNFWPGLPREQARAALEGEKQNRVIEEIVARRHIQVAEDFPLSLK